MKLTVAEWQAMPEIALPFRGEETGFTLTALQGHCPECGSQLLRARGEIYEAFGVIEVRMGGLCPACKHLVPCRCRVDPKTSRFMMEKNGKWETQRMISNDQRRKENMLRMAKKTLFPVMFGMLLCIILTCVAAKTNKWTWMGWGVILVVVMAMVISSKTKRG